MLLTVCASTLRAPLAHAERRELAALVASVAHARSAIVDVVVIAEAARLRLQRPLAHDTLRSVSGSTRSTATADSIPLSHLTKSASGCEGCRRNSVTAPTHPPVKPLECERTRMRVRCVGEFHPVFSSAAIRSSSTPSMRPRGRFTARRAFAAYQHCLHKSWDTMLPTRPRLCERDFTGRFASVDRSPHPWQTRSDRLESGTRDTKEAYAHVCARQANRPPHSAAPRTPRTPALPRDCRTRGGTAR